MSENTWQEIKCRLNVLRTSNGAEEGHRSARIKFKKKTFGDEVKWKKRSCNSTGRKW